MAMTMTVPPLMTAEEILVLDIPGRSTELVRGRLVVHEPPSTLHGIIAAKLLYSIAHFVYGHDLGAVAAQDTGFHIFANPDTVRAPDVAFIRKERLADVPSRGYAKVAPDLVIEIVSPNDRPGELLAKVGDWLQAGTLLAWVIDPKRRAAFVYRADGSISFVGEQGALEGEDVLPGWRCALEELLR
ncbi:MAG: Uma2 family endonuclease [Gemmatimonadaceae bacterium]|nr:Uma2 family endonuclease [Gemmatimonadaceae bacterium]